MKIYRIERFKDGAGLFATGKAKNRTYRIPAPARDGVFGTENDYYRTDTSQFKYGFQRKSLMKKWIPKRDLKSYFNDELSIVEYEISPDHVHFGRNQCAFNPKKAYSRRALPIKRVINKRP